MKKPLFALVLIVILCASCTGPDSKNRNIEILDIVWESTNSMYFDSRFDKVNWQEEFDHYKLIFKVCKSSAQFVII